MRLALLLLVAALVAGGCGPSGDGDPPAGTAAEAGGRYLAYTRFPVGRGEEVWLGRADGTGKRRLVEGRDPAVSPDGRWVAYNGGCDRDNVCRTLELVPTRGGPATLVSRRAGAHEWSPASDRVVFLADARLESYDLKTRRRRQLVSASGDWGFSVSPDGEEVVYALARPAGDAYFAESRVDLYVVGVAGGTPRRITRDGLSGYPAWGPDGIAFSRLLPYRGWGRHELWRIGADGSGRRTITGRLPARLLVSGVVGLSPVAWSADGKRLLAGLLSEFGAKPYAVDPKRGTIRELGDFGWAAEPEAISRDGRFVLASELGGVERLADARVEIVPWGGGPGRVVARRAGVASWNR
jgi:WD40-like Beta Propeller Repeat